ncbi:MAG: hypothetical protein U1C47_02325 [Hydrogenophaga sp.]|nr:hypothetical protein [Hydrogenophaga sp.]
MTTWTLLTAPGWVGKCPPMPGRNGPTYAEQIKVVSRWMAPAMRGFYEAIRWKECPHMIFALYLKATEFERLVDGDTGERNPRP